MEGTENENHSLEPLPLRRTLSRGRRAYFRSRRPDLSTANCVVRYHRHVETCPLVDHRHGFFGLPGIAGIYTRQVEKAGSMGLAGYLLLSLWFVVVTGFTFFETFILPLLASDLPKFAESFLGIFTGSVGETSVGALATLWSLLGVVYILGNLLFGIATFRGGILSRWAAGLLGLGAVLSPAFALLPQSVAPLAAVPVGLGLAWLGHSLWSERREPGAQRVPVFGMEPAPARRRIPQT
jgi:hypothetical protein